MATRSCASPAARWSTGRRSSSSAPRATRLPPTRGPDAMFLSDFSIKRPVATVVIIIALMCLGLLALNKLRVNQIPDVEQPVLVVSIDYPGASPDTVERALSVLLHAQKLRAYNISVSEVVSALRGQNTTAPVGKVRGALEDQSIRLVGRIQSPAEFEQIAVRRRGDEIVRLGQLATVQDGFAELTSLSSRNGRPNVGLSITRARDASTVTVAGEVRKLVDEIRKTLPQGSTLEVT